MNLVEMVHDLRTLAVTRRENLSEHDIATALEDVALILELEAKRQQRQEEAHAVKLRQEIGGA